MTNPSSCTLVTACFDLRKYHKSSRTFEETFENMNTILKLNVYLIIHTDSTYIDFIKEKREMYGFTSITKYVVETYEDLWCSQFTSKVKSNRETYWPSRDERTCPESHLLVCNKFDFVLNAIDENYFNTTSFGWIDSHLKIMSNNSKNINICEDYTSDKIPLLLSNIKDDKFHIQIMNVNDKKFLKLENKKEFYERYRWVVCGGLFVCGKNSGIKILNRLKEVVVETTMNGYGHGEESMYFDILDECYDDIHRSYGDYGQIVNNFHYPVKNLWYIFHYIANNYFQHGYHKECIDCCNKMIYSFENYLVEMDTDLYNNVNLIRGKSILILSSTI
jgi:hypothetical protein